MAEDEGPDVEVREEEEEEERVADCSVCNREFFISDLSVEYRNRWEYVCEACQQNIVGCYYCNDEFIHLDRDNFNTDYRGRAICGACYEDYYSSCAECGDVHQNGNMYSNDDDYDLYCPRCWDERNNDEGRINNYSFKPRPEFHCSGKERITDGTWFAGVEVEINVPERKNLDPYVVMLQDSDKYKLFYCKSDGSIGHGFEIVSHPMSWRWMEEHPDWTDPIAGLSKAGCVSYTGYNCGMHVHTPKASYGPMMMKRIHSFIRLNPEFIRLFANRTKQRLYEWANPECSIQVETAACKCKWNSDRFRAFNLAPESTAEFRIFRGTMSADGIKRNIEFCHALWSYSQNTDRITIPGLWDFARRYRKIYPRMYEKMERVIKKAAVAEEIARKTTDKDFCSPAPPKVTHPDNEWSLGFVRQYFPDALFDGNPDSCWCASCVRSRGGAPTNWVTRNNYTWVATEQFFRDNPLTYQEQMDDINTLNQIAQSSRLIHDINPTWNGWTVAMVNGEEEVPF